MAATDEARRRGPVELHVSSFSPKERCVMRVVIHDYAGHPFQIQLSRELAGRGYYVTHQYCASYKTGKGAVERTTKDPETFSVEPFSMSDEFARYSPARRVIQE